MHQPAPGKQYVEPNITVNDQLLSAVDKFTYLGRTLYTNIGIDDWWMLDWPRQALLSADYTKTCGTEEGSPQRWRSRSTAQWFSLQDLQRSDSHNKIYCAVILTTRSTAQWFSLQDLQRSDSHYKIYSAVILTTRSTAQWFSLQDLQRSDSHYKIYSAVILTTRSTAQWFSLQDLLRSDSHYKIYSAVILTTRSTAQWFSLQDLQRSDSHYKIYSAVILTTRSTAQWFSLHFCMAVKRGPSTRGAPENLTTFTQPAS